MKNRHGRFKMVIFSEFAMLFYRKEQRFVGYGFGVYLSTGCFHVKTSRETCVIV